MLLKKKILKLRNKIRWFFLLKTVDNYFVSYPKCGRTWVRYFLTEYIKQKYEVDCNLEFEFLLKRNNGVPSIVFTHGKYESETLEKVEDLMDKLSSLNKRIIFLIRNPKDVAVSHYFQINKREGLNPVAFSDLKEFIRNKKVGVSKIVQYFNLIYGYKNRVDDFLLVRYGHIKEDPKKEFRRILAFLNIPIDEKLLEAAVDESNFKNMQKKEKKGEINNFRLQPGDEKDPESYKVRRGKVGGCLDYCDKSDLLFMEREIKKLDENILR